MKRSGNYAFDLEARGAIESAGTAKAFGPLPGGFKADVLPVSFSAVCSSVSSRAASTAGVSEPAASSSEARC